MDNSGRYTPAELQILENAVHAYRDQNKHTQSEVNALLNSNARTNDFPGGLWDFICGALPNRERHSIQKAVKRKFNNLRRGPWKPEDDEELIELYRLYPNKWQKIGEENNRGAEASRDRWRNYCKNGEAQEKGEWPKEQEDLLAKLMRGTISILVKDRIKEIRAGRPVPADFEPADLLDYGILSEQMGGTRSRLQCRNKFEKFKARDDQRMEYIFEPLKALDGLEFQSASHQPRARPASVRSATMVSKSKSRITEEREALDNFNKKMLSGDKYYILTGISRTMAKAQVTDESDIPWDEIFEADSQTDWSILDRKIVLQQMQEEYPAPEDSNCLEIVDGIIDIMENDFDDETLEKHYHNTPPSVKQQRTNTKKGLKARKAVIAIKTTEHDDEDSPARSLPTPGSMGEDDEEDGV
jgi:Myb-like DNA-binding domain